MTAYENPKGAASMGTRSSQQSIATNETDRLIASDKVEGTAVYNKAGDHLGSVYNFMVDKYSGRVSHAVMSFGGFLGIGERYHPIPWEKLDYDPKVGGYVVDVDRGMLESAPSYTADEQPWSDPAYGRNLSGYYGVPYL
jgi:hypothetical protein